MIFDKNWRLIRHIKKYKNRNSLSDRGQYEVKYLIDRYVNLTTTDLISAYEKIIKIVEAMESFSYIYKSIFPEALESEEEEHERYHAFAALNTLSVFLYTLTEEETKKALAQIDKDAIDDFMAWHNIFIKRIEGDTI